MFGNVFNEWGPRLIGVAGGYIAGEAAKKGLTVDPATITTIMLATYAFLHRAISKKVNPGDAMKSVLVAQDKAEVASSTSTAAKLGL